MKTIRKALIIFILGVVGATLLMLLVNCLPNDKMQQHISESVEVMENEGDTEKLCTCEESKQDGFFAP